MSEPCPDCTDFDLEPRKRVEDNEVVESGWYCPNCEESFDEDTTFSWSEIDFPVWIERSYRNYNWHLAELFRRQTGLHSSVSLGREFKYDGVIVWWKVTEDGDVEGPYDEKRGERL